MPLVKIELLQGKSAEYRRTLLDTVHAALVDSIKIPDGDRMQRIYELDKEHFEVSSNKTENCVIIEVTMYRGRSYEAKKLMYKLLTERLEAKLGIKPSDVLVVLHEEPLENWSTCGVPDSETNLGFKIDV